MDGIFIIEQLLNGLGYGLMLFLIAAGLTLIFGIMDTMNLAHGSMFMVGAYVAARVHAVSGSFLTGVVAGVAATVVLAALLELAIIRRLYRRDHLAQVIATFGIILIADDVVKAIWGAAPIMASMPASLAGPVTLMPGLPYPAYRLLLLVAGLLVALGLYLLVNRTRMGMLVRAGASNRIMAEFMGVRVSHVFSFVFALGAALAALAGALMGPISAVQIGMGESILIPSLVVVVIGGIGSIRGAFIAALIVGFIDTAGRAFLAPAFKLVMPPAVAADLGAALAGVAVYVFMAVVLAIKPAGLFLHAREGDMTTSAFTGQAVAAQPRQSAGPWTPWVLLLALAVFPWVAPLLQLEYYVGFVERLLIMMIAASSLNFILGYGGMVALGHAGFIGVGAYAVAVMVEAGHDSAWLIWATAIIAAAVFSALIGLVALRTRGVYFIMITLAFAEMLHYVAVSVRTYGGDDGYSIYSPLSLGAVFDGMEYGLYWVVLACAALLFALMSRISGSRFGHALKGARDNEVRMAAMGYPVFFIRLAAFVGAGAVAGLAGAMLATHDGFVSPSLMDWTQSAILIVMVVIGGVGNRWGGVIGAGLWLSLQEGLRMFTEYWHWPLGILLLIIVFYAPEGIAARLRCKRSAA